MGREIFATGLWIALPLVAMLLFVNLVLGVISRVAAQINVFAIGFPITLGVGLLGMLLTLPLLQQPVHDGAGADAGVFLIAARSSRCAARHSAPGIGRSAVTSRVAASSTDVCDAAQGPPRAARSPTPDRPG
jgi:hypothetical protein